MTLSTYVDKPLAEHWNGTAWSVQTLPAAVDDTRLYGVSCTATTACTAVGSQPNANGLDVTYVLRWNGTAWSQQSSPNVAGTDYNTDLYAVSCVTGTWCTAVGSWNNYIAGTGTVAMTWNGTSWSLNSVAQPSGGGELYGVSCSSTTACTAVGYGGGAVINRWNGSSWALQTPAAGDQLRSVSCPTSTKCVAVGWGNTFSAAQVWNGTSWAAQSPPVPSGSTSAGLDSVACLSANYCEAAGFSWPGPKILADGYTG